MPEDYELTKYQMWDLDLLRGFFGALHHDQLPGFLRSDDLESFLHEVRVGPFGGKLGDGEPGSEIPDTGGMNPLDVLHNLFSGLGSDLGRIDRPGGADPASGAGAMDGSHPRDSAGAPIDYGYVDGQDSISNDTKGGITIHHGDGSTDTFAETRTRDGISTAHVRVDADGSTYKSVVTPDGQGGFWHAESGHDDTHDTYMSTHHFGPGGYRSPGEDGGGDANSDRNPLSQIEVIGPQSNTQAIVSMQNPGRDANELDPNSGMSAFKVTEADQARFGRIVPAMEVLDPNSGLDPLSQLNLDPNQINTRSEEDDRIDPNTGLATFTMGRGRGGGGFSSFVSNNDTKTNNET